MWTHLKAKHPLHWQMLKGIPLSKSVSRSAPEGGCSLTCSAHVSYMQMANALSNAPPATLSWAIVALQEAERRNVDQFAESVLRDE